MQTEGQKETRHTEEQLKRRRLITRTRTHTLSFYLHVHMNIVPSDKCQIEWNIKIRRNYLKTKKDTINSIFSSSFYANEYWIVYFRLCLSFTIMSYFRHHAPRNMILCRKKLYSTKQTLYELMAFLFFLFIYLFVHWNESNT